MCVLSCVSCCLSDYSNVVFFFKQKTAYEMRISDWSSDVCSSDLFVVEIEISKQVDGKTLDTVLGKGDQPIHALAVKRRAETTPHPPDRKSVVSGKSVPVRVDLGGRRIIKKTKKTQYSRIHNRQ